MAMELKSTSMEGYVIDFKDLKVGDYHFDMVVDGSLFARYEGCEVMDGDCRVAVEMRRSEGMIAFQVAIEGDVVVECDRCLDPCRVRIDYAAPLVVKFSDDEALADEYDGEVMWLPTASASIDLSHYIYESIIISLPYQRVHEEGECNPDMIARLAGVELSDDETGESTGEEESTEEEDNISLPQSELAKLMALKEKLEKE